MDETTRAPDQATRSERQGDMQQELMRQGYSKTEVATIQQHLNGSGDQSSSLAEQPTRTLVGCALALDIPNPQGLPKEELVQAIREAR